MEPEGSLQCSQEPVTSSYQKQVIPIHTSNSLSLIHFNIILLYLRLYHLSGIFSSLFPTKTVYTIVMRAACPAKLHDNI